MGVRGWERRATAEARAKILLATLDGPILLLRSIDRSIDRNTQLRLRWLVCVSGGLMEGPSPGLHPPSPLIGCWPCFKVSRPASSSKVVQTRAAASLPIWAVFCRSEGLID